MKHNSPLPGQTLESVFPAFQKSSMGGLLTDPMLLY